MNMRHFWQDGYSQKLKTVYEEAKMIVRTEA